MSVSPEDRRESQAPRQKVSKVCVIDDDPINNLICSNLLKKVDYADEVMIFESARQALAWFAAVPAAHWPEVIFLDINMPEIDGWGFLAAFPQPEQPPRIYILSSSMSEDDRLKSRSYALVQDFLTKPLTVDKLP